MNDSKLITAYIGLGSNLIKPIAQINNAHQAIKDLKGVKESAFSCLYSSPPMGPQDQPYYINAVMAVSTNLAPLDLLHSLQTIENEQGRIRARRWGARTLDLDILLYGDEQINLPDLIIPHIGLSERAFVLYPLQEIATDLILPSSEHIKDLIAQCPLGGLQKL